MSVMRPMRQEPELGVKAENLANFYATIVRQGSLR